MNAESYILLMVAGWLLIAAAMLWGMLRVARVHAQHAHLRQMEEDTAQDRETPVIQPVPQVIEPVAVEAKPAARRVRKPRPRLFHLPAFRHVHH
ncbi:hypothetical protein [Pseudomonas mangiferae]|uniref:Uncharacterized protein n=1 Tax=Pseudomonas mangiferae TaxID=2593654 RepID=A0A553H4F4_9PSED|nr:hypothetical protein [Pseudomonas mangiferae]TRX76640.1 hypothetical protein FM069_01035 [Pseudomonas mangiferae]